MSKHRPHLHVDAAGFAALVRDQWTEAEFLRAVIDLARANGWLAHHQRPARTARGWRTAVQGDAGFPDLVLVKLHGDDRRVIVAELKTNTGKMTPAQREWLDALNAAGVTAVVWRPRDWDAIVAELES